MKALVIVELGNIQEKKDGRVELREFPMPEVGDEYVLIKVAYASICGSDAHTLMGNVGERRDRILSELPRRMGHEVSGVIEQAGATAQKFGLVKGKKVTANYIHFCGTCYYCRNGQENFCQHQRIPHDAMSEYICWHMSQIYLLPDSTDLLHACLTEPTSIALHAVEVSQVKLGSNVAVFGAGGIGLMVVQLAKMAGAATVTIFEPIEAKRKLALSMGADFAIDPTIEDTKKMALQYTRNRGYDSVIEASGASAAAMNALEILALSGHIVYFSMYKDTFDLPLNLFRHMYLREAHLHGMFISSDRFEKTINMLPRMDYSNIIQKVYPLSEYQEAFKDLMSGIYARIVFKCS